MSALDNLEDLVQQWACAQDPAAFFQQVTNNGFHTLRFANAIHKHMIHNNDFSLLPQLFDALEGSTQKGIKISYLHFVSSKIIQGDKNFSLMLLLSENQQDKILPLILESYPEKFTEFEKILGRNIPGDVVFKSLIPSLNDLHHMKALSPHITSTIFLNNLSKVFHNNYPSGGVKAFAFWLAVPGYDLKMERKEFAQFENMIDFLDEQTMDERHIKLLEFAKRLLDMRHDTTNVEQFIQRSKILGALHQNANASLKRKM
jgi:hypothetical protein